VKVLSFTTPASAPLPPNTPPWRGGFVTHEIMSEKKLDKLLAELEKED
jgi:hypothetical protein